MRFSDDIPVPQVAEEAIEMSEVFSQDRVQQRNEEQIAETPTASLDEEVMEIPKTQTREKNICCLKEDQSEFLEELIIEKSDVPVSHVMEKTIEVVKLIPQEQAQNRTVRQITDVPVPRVMEENTEVEMLKLTSKLDGGCAAQAPEWEEPQRLRAEELATMRDVNKLPNDSDSFELFEESLPSPSVIQVQSDGRGVVHRARAVARKSSRSPGIDLISMGIDRAQDEDTSLATDIKSHASATGDPTAAAQHRSTQQHNNCHRKQQQQAGQVEEKGKEKKGRKGEGERGQEGRKEEEKEAKEQGREQVEKNAMDWTVVTRSQRQKKMLIQIFVKVDGSKVTPMEVSLKDDKVEDVMRRIQNDEDAYVTMHGRELKRSEKLKSCGVTDGCTIQVTSRLRGGGKHKDKKGQKERKQAAKQKGLEQKTEEEPKRDKSPVIRECDKDSTIRMIEGSEGYQKIVKMISERSDEEYGMQCFRAELREKSGLDENQMKVLECGVRWAVEARRKERSEERKGNRNRKSNGGRQSKDRTQDRSKANKANKCVSAAKNSSRRRERRAQTSRR